jgi:hypothetical protein
MENARTIIERAWEGRAQLSAATAPADVRSAVEHALAGWMPAGCGSPKRHRAAG